MVGVAVAMVISTIHKKAMHRFTQWKEFEKSSQMQSFTHLAITIMKLRKHHSHELFGYFNHITQLFRNHFLQN